MESMGTYARLAHLELLDELLSDDQRAERQRIYDELVPTYTDSAEQAYRVFEIVSSNSEGLVASVADQRLAQYDILLSARSYAALSGMTVDEIRDARWWAPNWAWSRVLTALDVEPPHDPDEMAQLAERVGPAMLRAGADSLVGTAQGRPHGRRSWSPSTLPRNGNSRSATGKRLARHYAPQRPRLWPRRRNSCPAATRPTALRMNITISMNTTNHLLSGVIRAPWGVQ